VGVAVAEVNQDGQQQILVAAVACYLGSMGMGTELTGQTGSR
jgi:hypothetical protein